MKKVFLLMVLTINFFSFGMEQPPRDLVLASLHAKFDLLSRYHNSRIMTRSKSHDFCRALQLLLFEVNTIRKNLERRSIPVDGYSELVRLINELLSNYTPTQLTEDDAKNAITARYSSLSAKIAEIENTYRDTWNHDLARSAQIVAQAYGFEDLYERALRLMFFTPVAYTAIC